jgi:hypothetical protein
MATEKNESTGTTSQISFEGIKEALDRGPHAIELFFDLSKHTM